MTKPFKFRYVNELTGAFVLTALAVLALAILITGNAQQWFESRHEVLAIFPAEGTMGVRRDTEVRVLETPAGSVVDVRPREDGRMELVMEVRDRFFSYLRVDSTATVRRAFGVAGDAYIEILEGTGAPLPLDEPAYIAVVKDTEVVDVAKSLLEEVRSTTVPAIEELERLLEQVRVLTEDLNAGQGTAGALLKDDAMAADMRAIVQGLRTTVDDLQVAVSQLAEASQVLPATSRTVAGEIEQLPGLVTQSQATLQEAEVLLEGLQRHWLIRRYIERDEVESGERLSPDILVGAQP
jgi:phospholipid/cholesterol/gamma-HCH transport system substrate-binding protein